MKYNKYIDLFLEKHQSELYHATNINALEKILEDNSIKLTFSKGADELGDKPFYLSTMRSKYGNYADYYRGKGKGETWSHEELKMRPAEPQKRGVGYGVIITLNGDAIKSIAQVKSINYWGKEFAELHEFREEQEERIMSDKSELTPLKKYVNEIHVFIDPDYLENKWNQKTLLNIKDLSKANSVPIYFYDKPNYFMSQVKSKALPYDDLENIIGTPKFDPDDKKYTSDQPRKLENEIKALIEIYKGVRPADEHIFEILKYHTYDAWGMVDAILHNAKNYHLKIFEDLAKIYKKENIKTVKEFTNLLIKKADQIK